MRIKHLINAIDNYYKSYSHKPHLAELPYDLRTNDPDELKERLKASKQGLKEAKSDLKDMKENLEINEGFIEEEENDIKTLSDENKELADKNAQIQETIDKVYAHFDEVAIESEEDGWNIKKQFDEIKNNKVWQDNNDLKNIEKFEEQITEFIDKTSLKGYISHEDALKIQELKKDLNNLQQDEFGNDLWDADEEGNSSIPYSDKDLTNLHDNGHQLQNMLDEYANKYDISKDTPLTQKLNDIETKGNLSDKWYEIQGANEKKIKQNTKAIETKQEYIKDLESRHSEIKREVGKLETKVNDFEKHTQTILDKMDNLGIKP